MHMSRRSDMPAYIHEFGHYGFQVSDEYVGGQCAHGTTLSGGPFAYGGLKASCMMYDPRGYTKICSDHVDNPHLTGTKQGDQDCWSELKGYFSDGGNGPGGLPRWILRTPVDRGAIPGPMPPIPLAGWRPRITSHPVSYPNLCQPIDLQWIRNGSPVQGAEVQVRSPGGRWLTQGITGSDGRIRSAYGDPAPITGVHIGDKVRASFPPPSAGGGPFFIAQRTITEDDCVSSSVVLSQVPGAEPELIQVELTAQPFDLRASLEPTATQGVARIRVRAATQLSEAPRVQFALSRDNQPRNVTVDYDANTNTYIGLVDELPYDVDAIIEVTASDDASRSATCVARASMSLPDTSEESEVLSSDGQLVLTIPAVGLPAGTYVTISPAPVGPPALDGNAAVVSGPYEIRAGDSSLLGESASLRFRLPFQNGDDVARSFDPDTFEIRRYDAVADAWIAMDGAYESHDPSVVTETTRLGSFVLIAGSVAAAGNADSENQNSGSGTGAQSSNAGGGSGPCGSGAALLTPLMLACLGIRSRRKVRAVNR